ncbi:MAG: hypothetical protein KatS3mg056_3482 [Chloroflexus sp.]|nr:MAG: hypothetical protein KatS3mg056_3288 [Chloroflexus sp.]GIV94773.1 MAG: hypothetical protein KatS3mg056_3482 [Chloroflexus sp.]
MRRPYACVAPRCPLEEGRVQNPTLRCHKPMHYPHVTLRQAGLQTLPVVQASSLRAGIIAIAVRCWP